MMMSSTPPQLRLLPSQCFLMTPVASSSALVLIQAVSVGDPAAMETKWHSLRQLH
jgi:hypothetical protein